MNTRKYPRTMQQAFGPYTNHQLSGPEESMHPNDKIVVAVGVAVIVGFLAVSLVKHLVG